MNESLRRALLRAHLSDEDVATRLEVDPKTVRRWLEGRLPYSRHRWALASMLGLDEPELWPQAALPRSQPEELQGIYSHRDEVPKTMWLSLFNSAVNELGILEGRPPLMSEEAAIMATLTERAQAGINMQICLPDPEAQDAGKAYQDSTYKFAGNIRLALSKYAPLQDCSQVKVRLHRLSHNVSLYRADEDLIIVHHAYGVSPDRSPVLRLHRADSGTFVDGYIESFNHVWSLARPLN